MSADQQSSQEWKPCDSGYLVRFARRARFQRRKRVATWVSAGAAVVLLAVSLAVWSSGLRSGTEENYFGGIACHEVAESLPAMMAGTVSDELRAKIEEHLRHCSRCQEAMRKMEAGQASVHAAGWGQPCDCPYCQRRHQLAIEFATTERKSFAMLLSMVDRPVTPAVFGQN
ncbi:MAG: zf-HC2 domain-containing protein [Pirellulales bacterium]